MKGKYGLKKIGLLFLTFLLVWTGTATAGIQKVDKEGLLVLKVVAEAVFAKGDGTEEN